jgi:hypothetical protein
MIQHVLRKDPKKLARVKELIAADKELAASKSLIDTTDLKKGDSMGLALPGSAAGQSSKEAAPKSKFNFAEEPVYEFEGEDDYLN